MGHDYSRAEHFRRTIRWGSVPRNRGGRLRGFEALPAVITGVTFKDGIELTKFNQSAA